MNARVITVLAMVLIIALPFLFRPESADMRSADDTVVIVTPHPESIRTEFSDGFMRWYHGRTGRTIYVDFRNPGGGSAIITYLDSEYMNAFRNYWVGELGRSWTLEIQQGFSDHRRDLEGAAEADSTALIARRAFLESDVGIGVDLFFGGGSFDFIRQTRKGQLVPSRFLVDGAAIFQPYPHGIPETFAGEPFYDPKGRWFGTVLSSFGIIYNKDALRRLGIEDAPRSWADLTDMRLFGQVAVADPSQSGSMNKTFEIIIQSCMQLRYEDLSSTMGPGMEAEIERRAIALGWIDGMQLIQRIAANARYFTDSAQVPNIDVAIGDCAAGIAIDFYGRYQQEVILSRGGSERFSYVTPVGMSSVSVDPIGLLRGARNREAAEAFIAYVMSPEGQALWNFKVDTKVVIPATIDPGGKDRVLLGPTRFPLRRLPIIPMLYDPYFGQFRSDPDVNPYAEAEGFHYRPEWTVHLFTEQRFLIRTAFIDVMAELRSAMHAIIEARREGRVDDSERALEVLSDLSAISYEVVQSRIRDVLARRNKIEEVRLARELSNHFRHQYERAERIARNREEL